MSRKGIWNISIQQIQIFLKAVEIRNFTKVAEFYNYTPSMVSKTISALESELELKLFVRKPHELAPTQTALFLAGQWRQLIGSVNNSIEKARIMQNSPVRSICLGFVDSSSTIDELIQDAILKYKEYDPAIRIIAEKHDMHRAVELLNAGMLDLTITSDIETRFLDDHGLPWEKLYDTSACVYVPRRNHLFDRESLSFKDLSGQKTITLDRHMHPSYAVWLDELCRRHSITLEIIEQYRTVRSLLFNLKLNDAIFIGDSITSDWCDDSLRSFFLPEETFSLVSWRRDSAEEILAFKDYLIDCYRELLPT